MNLYSDSNILSRKTLTEGKNNIIQRSFQKNDFILFFVTDSQPIKIWQVFCSGLLL